MGITVTKQRYKIKPLLCVTDKNPNNITWNVLVFYMAFTSFPQGKQLVCPPMQQNDMCNIAYICCGADEADDTEFAYYNQAESSFDDASRELQVQTSFIHSRNRRCHQYRMLTAILREGALSFVVHKHPINRTAPPRSPSE